MKIRTQIAAILRSPEQLAGISGKSLEKPADIAMNTAGLLAVSEAVGIFAMLGGEASDENYLNALRFFTDIPSEASPDANNEKLYEIAKRIAHATWAAGQIFRGIIETPQTPYARLGRKREDGGFVFDVYDNLPSSEVAKDWEQIKKYAKALLDLVDKLELKAA